MILNECFRMRFYAVSQKADESGFYTIEPFESEQFNQEFDFDDLDNELDCLRDYLYGDGTWYQIDDDACVDGIVCVQPSGSYPINIADIRDQIYCDEGSSYFIIVDADCSKCEWIVCEPQGSVYTD